MGVISLLLTEFQEGKNKKSGVNSPLPPNVLQQGQNAKTLKNGTIELGTNLPTRK